MGGGGMGWYLVQREGGGHHANEHVEQVADQLGLGVQGERQHGRRGGHHAQYPHLTLPDAVELIEGLPASLRKVGQLPVPWRTEERRRWGRRTV